MKKENMGFILFKKLSLLLLLFSAAIFATSFAGRPCKVLHNPELKEVTTHHEELWKNEHNNEESVIHERILKVKTNDYGKYDPAPALKRPPFKLIPN